MAVQYFSKKELLKYFYEDNLRPYLAFHKNTKAKILLGKSIAAEYVNQIPDNKKALRILNIGCGDGKLTRTLIEKLVKLRPDLKIHLVAADPAEKILNHAHKNLLNLPSNVTADFHQVGVKAYPHHSNKLCNALDGELFDLLVVSFVLHWIDEFNDAIDQLFECLSPHGSLCIAELSLEKGKGCYEFRRRLFKAAYEKERGPFLNFFAEDFEKILWERAFEYKTVCLQTVADLKTKNLKKMDEIIEFLTALPYKNWTGKQKESFMEITNSLSNSGMIICGYKILWMVKNGKS